MFKDENRGVVIASQVGAVLIVVLSLLSQRVELSSERPTTTSKQITGARTEEGRFARLWDDPLEDLPAFQPLTAGAKETSPTSTPPPDQATRRQATDENKAAAATQPEETQRGGSPTGVAGNEKVSAATSPEHTVSTPTPTPSPRAAPLAKAQPASAASPSPSHLILWNLLDARPLPEMAERRLRTRYAIVSAILAKGYLPSDESLLRPIIIEPGTTPIGYFETFYPPKDKGRWVSLVWTSKDISNEITEMSVMNKISEAKKIPQLAAAKVLFLHHGGSDDLIKYLGDPSKHALVSPKRVAFTRATIPETKLPKTGLLPFRAIASDNHLIEALCNELKIRIPDLNPSDQKWQPKPMIAVFTEADTGYGRALMEELRQGLGESADFRSWTYLRGLDGREKDDANISIPKSTSQKNDPITALLQRRTVPESSRGTSQFDYLRRAAFQLVAKQRQNPRAQMVVGVLGSDIYDKLLVLQAVHPQLPAAIFFTTDLDALYLEKDNAVFTRNLIVASPTDLTALGLPPMRDSYQTCVARYVSKILDLPETSLNEVLKDFSEVTDSALLFEITDGRAIKLADKAHQPVIPCYFRHMRELTMWIFFLALCNAFAIVWAISTRGYRTASNNDKPRYFRLVRLLLYLQAAISVAALLLLLCFPKQVKYSYVLLGLGVANVLVILWVSASATDSAPRAPYKDPSMPSWARALIYGEVSVAGAFLIVLLGILWLHQGDLLGDEPLALGATIWPSVAIRLLAFVVAILFLLNVSRLLLTHRTAWKDRLASALPDEEALPLADDSISEIRRWLKSLWFGVAPPYDSKTFGNIFDRIFSQGPRRNRVILASLLYFIVSAVLFSLWPPVVPARGPLTFVIEKVVLALGVALYIVHLIYCLDLHLSAVTLLRVIGSFYSDSVKKKTMLKINPQQFLVVLSEYTAVVGKTLLYPLTVLTLIILSRLPIFDAWGMTISLAITFLGGAALVILSSLLLWRAGAQLKQIVSAEYSPAQRGELLAIEGGVFGPWYQQPVFTAIFSVTGVFGTVGLAGLIRMFAAG